MIKLDQYIDGAFAPSASYALDANPSDESDPVGELALGTAADVERAVAAARAALPTWSHAGPQQRFDLLDAVGSRILDDRERLATLLAREEGKTLPEARGEVVRAGQIFKFFAGEALRVGGEILASVRPGLTIEATREPVGVVGLITPWNFPIAIPAWKIAPALAFGNTVVIKPSELAPGCAHALAALLHEAGCPRGVFNLVMGEGRVVGDALVSARGVAAVSFTGSVQTGGLIAQKAVTRQAKLQLEMGGKNPLVVLDDADLDRAVDAALQGSFFSTGQRCTASSRLIVTAKIHDAFVAALKSKMRALRVGHALAPETQIGPVVDERQLEKNQSYLKIAADEGCEVLGGELVSRPTRGHFMAPALLLDATAAMRSSREEIFGPVASVIRAADYDEALALANDTELGLTAGICTPSLARAAHFKRHADAGMVMVNAPTAGIDYHVPFGGRKGSSYGPREQGSHAREFYTTVKTAYVAT